MTVVDVSSLVMCLMSTAIGNAFAVLSDAQKRKRYDEFGSDDTELRRRRHPNGYDYDFSRGFEGKYHDSLCVFSCVHAACMSCSLHVSIKKGAYSSSCKNASQNYRVSPAVWVHTVLPVTRHRWTHPALTPAIKAGTQFTYPQGMEGWVNLAGFIPRCYTCQQMVTHPSTNWRDIEQPHWSRPLCYCATACTIL